MVQGVLDRLALQTGGIVFKEGEKRNQAYVVQEGAIEIVSQNNDGADVVLGTVEKGDIFGKMALINDQPHKAKARAAAGRAVIDRKIFHGKLASCDPFIRNLLSISVKPIRSMVECQLGS